MNELTLRPYQITALDKLRLSLGSGNKRVMLYAPTGSGKTVTAEQMIRGALAKGKRVAFIANRKQLVGQASEHLTRAGIEHGILQADNTRSLEAKVLVCSIDTIHARGFPDDCDLIVIDEAHACAGSQKYRQLLERHNAVPVVGLTATPFAPGLGEVFSDLVVAATIRELIEAGYLVDLDAYAPSDPDLTGVSSRRGIGGELDYAESQLAAAVDRPELVGDIVEHWQRLASGRQTVVFATNIPHSKHIVDAFRAAGISAEHLDYRADDDARADILKRFACGEFSVLSNCSLLSEGWDCPSTEVMILARPTRSLTRFIQMVGRVLRPAPGKARALLLDHSGTTVRLGFPTDDLPLELDDGKGDKSGTTRDREIPEPKPCPACKFVRPAGTHVCPACGFAPEQKNEVLTVPGELVRLDRKMREDVHREVKQHAYSQLLQVADDRGYAEGWVAHQYRKMFDVWPRGLDDERAVPTKPLLNWLTSQRIRYARGAAKHGARAHG